MEELDLSGGQNMKSPVKYKVSQNKKKHLIYIYGITGMKRINYETFRRRIQGSNREMWEGSTHKPIWENNVVSSV